MIVRRNRLARTDFPTLLKYGRRVTSPHFSLIYTSSVQGCAVVVSKKNVKTAVGRHKIKRRVQSILTTISPHYGYVVFTGKKVDTLSFFEIQEELGTLLTHLIT